MLFFFFNDTATTEIYTLSLHDALPISTWTCAAATRTSRSCATSSSRRKTTRNTRPFSSRSTRPRSTAGSRRRKHRSEEHTSELQSRQYLVCRLLLEKKKKKYNLTIIPA